MARVLVVGSGGREHALGWKLAQSKMVDEVYFAPGNGGTSSVGENIAIDTNSHEEIVNFAGENEIELVVVGPEQPLVDGLVDALRAAGIASFGPSAAAAQLEASKAFTADFLESYDIPRPESVTAGSLDEALDYVKKHEATDFVVKASGLAAGKGVIVPENREEAEAAVRSIMEDKVFGAAGDKIVFQERLVGQELSAFALSDGKNIAMLPFFQDHKQVYDGDKGPNTGGMGAYSPVPFVDENLAQRIKDRIMQPSIDGMAKEGKPYQGVLYAGLFVTEENEPKVIEFNCRFGDPECQPMMMALDEDLYPLLKACVRGNLTPKAVQTGKGAVATVVLASGGYPAKYQTGEEIFGLGSVDDSDITVFHAGTKIEAGKLVTSGGRVLGITARGLDMKDALDKAYSVIGEDGVHFADMHYRHDIGKRVL